MRLLVLGGLLAAVGIVVVVLLSGGESGQARPSVVQVEMARATSDPDFASDEQVRKHGGAFLSGTADVPAGDTRLVLDGCPADTVPSGFEMPDTPPALEAHGLRADGRTMIAAIRNAAPLSVRASIGLYCRPGTTKD